jgi:hypothetical protein
MSRSRTKPTEEDFRRWVSAVGETTIPLLAGFSVTSVIVVSDNAANFRWPGPAILALGLASVVLIIAVQCGYIARERHSSGETVKAWARAMQITYYCGVVALLAGLGLVLAPLHGTGVENVLRWIASVIAFAGCGLEVIYIFRRWRSGSPVKLRLAVLPAVLPPLAWSRRLASAVQPGGGHTTYSGVMQT